MQPKNFSYSVVFTDSYSLPGFFSDGGNRQFGSFIAVHFFEQ